VKLYMDIRTKDLKREVNIWPEKLYTQQEVDNLFKKRGKNSSSQKTTITEESQIANKQKRKDNKCVECLVRKSNRILASITTLGFPFKFFPDTINIEEGRITIIIRNFFFSSQVHSVDIKDISNVFINMAPFFAELVIVSNTYERNIVKKNYFRKSEAIYARRLIEGLRILKNNNIDTSTYTKRELIKKLEELSTTEIVM
jgi:hypothetical protein